MRARLTHRTQAVCAGLAVVLFMPAPIGAAAGACSVLVAGQSLALGLHRQRAGFVDAIDEEALQSRWGCASIDFVDATLGGSSMHCAVMQGVPAAKQSRCWVNHDPALLGGARHGEAMTNALARVDATMNAPDPADRSRNVAVIWSQGERDTLSLTKPLPTLVTEPPGICDNDGVVTYCKAAYRRGLNETIGILRGAIAAHTRRNFARPSTGVDIPVLMVGIGRIVFLDEAGAYLRAASNAGVRALRRAQTEVARLVPNVYVAAYGYDLTMPAVPVPGLPRQVHLFEPGYYEVAYRMGLVLNDIVAQSDVYVGPDIASVARDGTDVVVTVRHATQTIIDLRDADRPCGLAVEHNGVALAVSVRDVVPPRESDGWWYTDLRLSLPALASPGRTVVTYAHGDMAELNVPRIENGIVVNAADNVLVQRCAPDATPETCADPRRRILPVQPAAYAMSNGQFVRTY